VLQSNCWLGKPRDRDGQGITCGETGMRFGVALLSGAKEDGWSCRWDVL
jgi:hypothetical protein